MAFSEEQEAQIIDTMNKFNEFISKQGETQTPPDDKDKNELLNEAKKNVENKNNEENAQADIERALSFNMKISEFVEKYKDILPASSKSVVEVANGKTYSSAIAKANEMRKAIIQSYLEVQTNIDCLPDGMKTKANDFKNLTEDAKTANSGQYWEIVEVGAELQASKKRAEAVNRANGNNEIGQENAFRERFLSLGEKYKRKE